MKDKTMHFWYYDMSSLCKKQIYDFDYDVLMAIIIRTYDFDTT